MNTDIYHFMPTSMIRDALQLFVEKNISGAPLIADERLAGFVSDGYVLAHLGREVPLYTTPYSFLAERRQGESEFD
ncbi:CBS domain-containing protein [Rothia amarae]|uniref:CBS domain-containing protein n=1 Tax=Rothia amarae TaxID=169480 RepID=A0A7H2BLH6_9MICC|nr:CBS domain-containing protein [Rothia amarae]QNV40522.1 CBS domain-containing protein [Rothia amarae]